MEITQAQILRAVPNTCKENLDSFVASFNQWAIHYGIDTPKRIAMYLSQVFTETGYLKSFSENMNYSADRLLVVFHKYFKTKQEAQAYAHKPQMIANRVYGGRMGNGNEASGDGWKYRGRGCIGLTGRSVYGLYSKSDLCTDDIMNNPDLVATFPNNQKSAMWFWQTYNLNKYADVCDIEGCSKKVNGGTNGLADRKYFYRRFCREFGINTR